MPIPARHDAGGVRAGSSCCCTIVMVAMSLAAIVLIRSVARPTRSWATRLPSGLDPPANASIEQAAADFFRTRISRRHASPQDRRFPAENYYAQRQAGETRAACPVLQKKSTAVTLTRGSTNDTVPSHLHLRHVLARTADLGIAASWLRSGI
jgi:hypothetical protein